MLLILGERQDNLIGQTLRDLEDSSISNYFISEFDLFSNVKFSYEYNGNGNTIDGFIRLDEDSIKLSELSGVLVRLPRTWWPSSEFDYQDRMFVYHETIASWFNTLSSLRCTVVNRYSLGWWLHDLNYCELISKQLAERIHIDVNCVNSSVPENGRIIPTHPNHFGASLYMVGTTIIPSADLYQTNLAYLTDRKICLHEWQQEHGILFCRLDFNQSSRLQLRYVELFPLLENEDPETLKVIGRTIIGMLK